MRLTWPARSFIAAVVASAGIVAAACATRAYPLDVREVALLGALFLLAEAFPVALPRGGGYSVSFVVSIAAIVTQGPLGAALVASAGGLNLRGVRRHPAPVASRLFNGANFAACTGLAALVYTLSGGPVGDALVASPIRRTFLPIVAATGVNFALNTWLVSLMLWLATPRRRFRSSPGLIWRTEFAALLPGYYAFAFIGLLLGVLTLHVHAAAPLLVLVPLLVARGAFATAVRAQNAYETTVETLVTAIEAKDRYTRDHSGRVAMLTELLAREYGMRGDVLRTVRLAALMHDIGKIGVPTSLLTKPGKLTSDEYDAIKDHPLRGFDLVSEIDLIRDVVAGVRHHHERMDGSGYPDGLKGDEIPLIARIVAVCDAFDSMTSTRLYRRPKSTQEAFAELRRCAGAQFDPAAVDGLERALAKHEWRPEPEIDRLRRRPTGDIRLDEPAGANMRLTSARRRGAGEGSDATAV